MTIKSLNKQNEIRNLLITLARDASKPLIYTYGTFGKMVGIFNMRGTKDLLDAIAKEEQGQERPDVTYMLVNADWGYPSQIGGYPAKPPQDWQRQLAYEEMQKIIKDYRLGETSNPYRP
ncbi:UNVERIFIED_ORG: hypothetical protein GGD43_000008 [Rhizobium esperanzae]